ncbi:MAG TPA: glycosyl hydrolase family 65 protein [Tepidisphaeraceae bacterium]|jgi:hypothetical protein|nr:glycosyl hydrolase family 65 protein [Tepidisphaeraceae bacterium]
MMDRLKFAALFFCVALAVASRGRARVIRPEDVRHYVDSFNAMDPEKVVNLIPDAKAWDWMTQNVPMFECPDPGVEEMYYFRWWTYRKHIRQVEDFIAISEFLGRKPVSSAVGHHIYEGRWIHDNKYLDQDVLYWLRGTGGKPHDMHNYSSWTVWAAYQRYLVNGDRAFIVSMLDDFLHDDQQWEKDHLGDDGLYWQQEARDAMEDSINGDRKAKGRRPSINSYMYGNALAIAAVADLAGRQDIATLYTAKAAAIKKAVQEKLWDPKALFFKIRWENGTFSTAREEIGFIPWYFELPDPGYEAAWKQLTDPRGFWAPFGITTAERRDPRFRTHGSGHSCEWDGPVWPFATSQTLTALANVLNDYPNPYVTKKIYLQALQTYVRSQHLNGKPYIGEYLDEKTGQWLRTDLERGRYYNHSTFCDLIISGLVGLRPRSDQTVVVNPLVPDGTWDWFCLDNVLYHGRILTIIWDRTGQHFGQGAGLTVMADGQIIAHADKLQRLLGDLGK